MFAGAQCEIDLINECETMPCGENAACLNGILKRECICPYHLTPYGDRYADFFFFSNPFIIMIFSR